MANAINPTHSFKGGLYLDEQPVNKDDINLDKQPVNKENVNILVFLLLASGFLIAWISKGILGLQSDEVFAFLFLLPAIVYVIYSGRLKELKGPGGLEAKFVDVAKQSVEVPSETIEESDMQILEKGSVEQLSDSLPLLDESRPIILKLTLGRYYSKELLLMYLEGLSQYRALKFVVFLDHENKFVAYIPFWSMFQILKMDALGDEFVSIINEGNIPQLRQYRSILTRTISTESTNVNALREMINQNVEGLVVIDEDKKLKGVIEREQLLSKLLLGMAEL